MTGQPAGEEPPTRRAVAVGWGLLLARLLAHGYLLFLVALVGCAIVPTTVGLTGTVVQSGSMMPHIRTGDIVLSRPLPAQASTPMGHVVTFAAAPGSATLGTRLHRIVGSNPDDSLITAGDANRDMDSAPLERTDIIAVATLLIPWIGLPAFWLQHGLILPFAGWVAVTLLALIIEFLSTRDEKKERRGHEPKHARRSPHRSRLPIGVAHVLPMSALVLCAAMVITAPSTPAASAAFTATTVNSSSNWVAAVVHTPTKLAFTTNPSSSTGGTAFASQPAVAIQTSSGASTTSTAPVTLSITTPAGATLACTSNPVAAVTGRAQFTGCKIDKAGTYRLTATSPGLATATSTSFAVSVGPASRLVFATSPGNTARNTAFSAQPAVAVQDAGGNMVTTSAIPITLSVVSGTLTCTSNPKNAVAGVATFSGCRIDQSGSKMLTARSGSLSGTSSSFTIFSSASKLAFLTSPTASTSGVPFASQPVVAIQDSAGYTTGGTSPITLTITTPSGATLVCSPNPVAAVNGTATFNGCTIGKAGTYTLTATTTGLSSATSTGFTITAGPATRLNFAASASNSASSIPFATQPVVVILDAFGNTTTSTAPIALAITTPVGTSLACTNNPKAAVSGTATFTGCRVARAGTYTLTATASGLSSATSGSFTIVAGTAAKVTITTSPTDAARGVSFSTQPAVAIQDAAGNLVSSSLFVALTITAPTGGANLGCFLNPILTLGGTWVFSGCRIDRAGTYTLTAASSGLVSGHSTTFVVN
ncbi:S26 family signal peptidase [Microbacterium sp.]|uniref:S26 family signal peptidase n=1 Tax=Microbacterium sp. TaxID=51671 RepID=UPI00281206B8|nr:S26 family signal peptidase [Microbacterium sp.]